MVYTDGKHDVVWFNSTVSKKSCFENFCKFFAQENTCAGVSLIIKLQAVDAQFYIKKAGMKT